MAPPTLGAGDLTAALPDATGKTSDDVQVNRYARQLPYPAATMFAWTAWAVAVDAAPEVKTPS